MNKPKILVVGSANADLVVRTVRCPKPGESLIGSSFETIPGGKGANQAVAASRLGAHTVFAGCVGADALGEMLRASLRAAGVDTGPLKTHETAPTGTAVIIVAEDAGQNCIVVTPSANYGILPSDIERLTPLFEEASALLVQLEIPLETVEAALRLARQTDTLSILDAGPAQRVPGEIVRMADVVSPNETEAAAMTGVTVDSFEKAKEAAVSLREMGASEVVLKLGEKGCYYSGAGQLMLPAFCVKAVDTTAAGDAFTAALACVWRRMPTLDALRFANAAGALAATAPGAQPSMPTLAAVNAFLETQAKAPAE